MPYQHPPIELRSGLPIIPYGPGMPYVNEAALLAALPVGSVVYDMAETVEANRMKRIRYVADLNGPDTVYFTGNEISTASDSAEFSFVFCDPSVGPPASALIIASWAVPTSASRVRLTTGTNGRLIVQAVNAAGAIIIANTTVDINVCNGAYHKVAFGIGGGFLRLTVDGVVATPASIAGWDVPTLKTVSVNDVAGVRPMLIANATKIVNGSIVDCWELSESSGTTLANQCNPSNPATLTDSTAHAKTCVPLSLGG